MNKLRAILAVALLAVPALTLNASAVDQPATAQFETTQPVTGCCWALVMGRWICYPCGG